MCSVYLICWEKCWWIFLPCEEMTSGVGRPFPSLLTQFHVWESHLTNHTDTKQHKGSQADMSEHAHLQRGYWECFQSIPVWVRRSSSLALPWAAALITVLIRSQHSLAPTHLHNRVSLAHFPSSVKYIQRSTENDLVS